MISEMYSVFDGAVRAFLPPFFVRSRGEALRSFTEACNDGKHQFAKHSADYTMFFLGGFDDSSGTFDCPATPVRVVAAQECIVDEDLFPPNKRLPM